MPLYEYQCQKCKKVFEMLVRSDKDYKNIICPYCNNKKADKMFSTFGTNSDQRNYADTSPVSSSSSPTSQAGKSGCKSCSGGTCSTCK
ncbi:MAG: FmdB family zinc ribbon protein [Planctomycetota bacterium]